MLDRPVTLNAMLSVSPVATVDAMLYLADAMLFPPLLLSMLQVMPCCLSLLLLLLMLCRISLMLFCFSRCYSQCFFVSRDATVVIFCAIVS